MSYFRSVGTLILFGGILFSYGERGFAQTREEGVIADSILTMREIMQIPAKSIPLTLMQKAEGVAIFPGMVKGGFILGAQRGRGILVIKNDDGQWENPRFATLTGGSLGFQAGIQSADVILVLCTRRSVESAVKGHFTVGADATVTAGPVGRQATVGTDLKLTSEIYSYSRSRGIFLGAAIDGCVMEIDHQAMAGYYRNGTPKEAADLVTMIRSYAGEEMPENAVNALELTRIQLAEANGKLQAILEPQWQTWLALPKEVFLPEGRPVLADLVRVQERFTTVGQNPQYAALQQRSEFQTTSQLLHQYIALLTEKPE
ncbi:MAG: lipid-binding SYLF domain-containing protein [Planctomycetia bacterium]|nr:lipid-binding SYLF domain-containing protein [Planctomycetia bacterium]